MCFHCEQRPCSWPETAEWELHVFSWLAHVAENERTLSLANLMAQNYADLYSW
jgi:hypothetical protein